MNIRIIRVLSLLIMAAAAAVSYGTQRGLFLRWGVDEFTAAVAPIAVDLLAIICTLAVHTDDVAAKGRRAAIITLIVTVTASSSANFAAGHGIGSKIVHAGIVVLYLLAEWIAAQVHEAPAKADVDAKRSAAARKAAATRKANAATKAKTARKPKAPKPAVMAALEESYSMPSAPVSPAAG